jgi:hypothetical protein
MVRRCPHGKRIKSFASCELCNAEINAVAIARLTSRHTRMLLRTATIRRDKDHLEGAEVPAFTLNKVAP